VEELCGELYHEPEYEANVHVLSDSTCNV